MVGRIIFLCRSLPQICLAVWLILLAASPASSQTTSLGAASTTREQSIAGQSAAGQKITDTQKASAIASLERVKHHAHLSGSATIERLRQKIDTHQNLPTDAIIRDYMRLLRLSLDSRPIDDIRDWSEELRDIAARANNQDAHMYADLTLAYLPSLEYDVDSAHEAILELQSNAVENDYLISAHYADNLLAVLGPETGNFTEGLTRLIERTKNPDTHGFEKDLLLASYEALAFIYTSLDEYDDGLNYHNRAIDFAEKHNLPYDREAAVYNIGLILFDADEHILSQNFFSVLSQITEENNNPDGDYYVLYGLALNAFELEAYDEAIDHARSALANFPNQSLFDIDLDFIVAESLAAKGDLPAARVALEKIDRILAQDSVNTPDRMIRRDLLLADILFSEGEYEQSRALVKKASKDRSTLQTRNLQTTVRYLKSSLDVILEKQAAERALENSEAAYLRLSTFVFFIFLGIAIISIFIQRRYARTLEISSRNAERASKAKSEFLANMSHELRTPLNAILGFSDIMRRNVFGKLGAEQYQEYVTHINESGHHLLDIINDILDLSKIEAGKVTLSEETISLSEIIEDAVSYVQQRADNKGLTIEWHDYDTIPLLWADPRMIKQICLNILSNAIKFTKSGGTVKIQISQGKKGDGLHLCIEDTGVGMTDEEIEIALQPFGQAGNTFTRGHEGTGLGLPLVQSLVELHGGSLKISSRKGLGTKVDVCFPPERLSHESPEKLRSAS